MEWTKQSPQSPGIYWYQHRDQEKHSKASNRPEPVKLTSDGRILFLGDWRGHVPAELSLGLWGERIEYPG